ncbi:hypothetical protein Bbelb_435410 [Branchiostoma belcheri]|nr:hypothetical protein Bbelb_435410 [Branchiostoma belcheri]
MFSRHMVYEFLLIESNVVQRKSAHLSLGRLSGRTVPGCASLTRHRVTHAGEKGAENMTDSLSRRPDFVSCSNEVITGRLQASAPNIISAKSSGSMCVFGGENNSLCPSDSMCAQSSRGLGKPQERKEVVGLSICNNYLSFLGKQSLRMGCHGDLFLRVIAVKGDVVFTDQFVRLPTQTSRGMPQLIVCVSMATVRRCPPGKAHGASERLMRRTSMQNKGFVCACRLDDRRGRGLLTGGRFPDRFAQEGVNHPAGVITGPGDVTMRQSSVLMVADTVIAGMFSTRDSTAGRRLTAPFSPPVCSATPATPRHFPTAFIRIG